VNDGQSDPATVGRGYAAFWATSTSRRIGDAADSRVVPFEGRVKRRAVSRTWRIRCYANKF
jgi:hypothetical protein